MRHAFWPIYDSCPQSKTKNKLIKGTKHLMHILPEFLTK